MTFMRQLRAQTSLGLLLLAVSLHAQTGTATAANIGSILQSLTGCTTATYLYSPPDARCEAPGAGSMTWPSAAGYALYSGSSSWSTPHLTDNGKYIQGSEIFNNIGGIASSYTLTQAQLNSVVTNYGPVLDIEVGYANVGVFSLDSATPTNVIQAIFGAYYNGGPTASFGYAIVTNDYDDQEDPLEFGEEKQLIINPSGSTDYPSVCEGCVGVNAGTPGAIKNALDVYGAGSTAGVINAGGASGGFKINNAATSAHYLRGNGTIYADSAIQTGDLPQLNSLINVRVLTSGSGATYTPTSGTGSFLAIICGAGGGGGGVTYTSSSDWANGGGGAAGACAQLYETGITAGQTGTYTVSSTGGTAGANTGGTGGTGTSSTFAWNGGGTVTGTGGLGGVGQTFGTTAAMVAGGAGQAATGGTLNASGDPGWWAYRVSGTVGVSGTGGSCNFGGGGAGLTADGAGNAGTGYCAGGGGGVAHSAARAGGAGAPGVIVIYEYK